jgi:hypothetical protein
MSLLINSVTCSNSIQVRLFLTYWIPHSLKFAILLYSYLLPTYLLATCRWQEIKFVTDEAHSVLPIPRYVHTAVVYKNGMYIHGGKTDINGVADTLEDFWRFDFGT